MTKIYESAFDAIFDDDKEQAENLKIRALLLLELSRFIAREFEVQKEAAKFFGEKQPTISAIVNGSIHRFTIDKLVELISKAGYEVQIRPVKPAQAKKRAAVKKAAKAALQKAAPKKQAVSKKAAKRIQEESRRNAA